MNKAWLKALIWLLFLSAISATGASAGLLQLTVIDDSLGVPVPARVLVRGPDGMCRVPQGATILKIGRDMWFMSEGAYTVELPPGRAELRVERGKEYIRVKENLDIPPAGTVEHLVRLKRWIHMQAAGYKSLENHLHVAPEAVAAMCAAEDLCCQIEGPALGLVFCGCLGE